jgi:hypothetical protein
MITGGVVALVAGLVPIQILGEMTSIGTLFAFVIVCAAVMVLRAKRPEAHRPFRVPGGPIIPILGTISCIYLMLSLSVMTWVRFLGWLDIGMVIYWFYGRTHSPLVDRAEAASRTAAQGLANFLAISGWMLAFNGFAIALLGKLTEWGVTTEELAKWSELDALFVRINGWIGTSLHINPEIADAFGLKVLAVGLAIAAIGWAAGRSLKGARPVSRV